MPTLRPGEILDALSAGTFAALLGTSEDDAVECEAAPYRTGDERERIELAKDVSGLANANGGLVLIGARTERAHDSREDVIRAVSVFDRHFLDAERYQAILASAVYPTMTNVQFRWFESSEEPGRGVSAIVSRHNPRNRIW